MAFNSNNIEDYVKIYEESQEIECVKTTTFESTNVTEDVEMQLLDIDFYHSSDNNDTKHFHIMLFGKTKDDKSVYVQVNNYYPYFFVEIEPHWRNEMIAKIISDIKEKVYPKKNVDGLMTYKIVKKHKFYGFTNDELFSFIQLTFQDYDSMRSYANAFSMKHKLLYLSRIKPVSFNLYESNINPIIRFFHIQKIDPVGWIKIPKDKMVEFARNHRYGQVDINLACDWIDVEPLNKTEIHKFTILSYDIECTSEDGKFPANRPGDKVIQIGMTYSYLGESECFKKIIVCLDETESLPDVDVYWYPDEKDVLLKFTDLIRETDPDIIIGYNIFGFDWKYLHDRAVHLGIVSRFSRLSRIKGHVCKFIEQDLQSSALGQNKLKYYNIPGRVSIDLMKVVQRDFKLPSYKLDFVASNFIRDKIISVEQYVENDIQYTKLNVKSTFGIYIGDYITLYYNDGYTDNNIGHKHQIYKLDENKTIVISGAWDFTEYIENKWKIVWCHAKDDIEPNDIFRLFKQTAADRAKIAKYCVQDCVLCNRLISKLQILPNSIGMGSVCCVPLSYLFLRGQGVKIFSLVAKQCRNEDCLIPTAKKKKNKNPQVADNAKKFESFINRLIHRDSDDEDDDDENDTYEGATVYDPVKGVHYSPILVGDYGSLYPSCIIMDNYSHNSIVLDPKYDNLDGYVYNDRTYNNADGTTTTCRFAERKDGTKSTIPRIVLELLSARNKCKQLMETEKDSFKKSVLDGLQLAYKITANSLYGQCGAPTSPIFMKSIAACTTAAGRMMLDTARTFVETQLPQIIRCITNNDDSGFINFMDSFYANVPLERLVKKIKGKDEYVYNGKKEYYEYIKHEIYENMKDYNINPQCIYGDTDSVFFKLNMTHIKTGETFDNHDALKLCVKLGPMLIGIVNNTLKYPQVLNYEKVYWPFIIISKKRYVGNLYDYDPNNYYQKSMGLVTKRRDNADIVKVVVGGIIDHILNKRDIVGAIDFTKRTLKKIIMGKYNIEKFVITKTLKDKEVYADWTRMVHAVLADRMAQRDPGNKPQSNDRIPYVYIETKTKCKLQGDMVETPKYVQEQNLKIDYLFYITNQIMKPALQFLELIAKNPYAIFNMYIIREENRRSGVVPIMKYMETADETGVLSQTALGNNLFGISNHVSKKQSTRKCKNI